MSIRQGKIIIADSVSSTTDYQDLINKPKINGVELDGNKTTEDLNINVGITSVNGDTGTDGAVTVKAIENANPNDTMLKIWNGTTAEYLALAEKDLNTVYNVTDEVTADSSKISGFNLFDFKWSDHIINNISWTRADNFSWHSAAVYVSAYNKLLKEKERASTVLETETIDDITISFYRSENNYKICLPDQLANLTSLYEKTGVAWYYVIDTENKQFKLPRTKWGFTGLRNKAGDYVSESLPNITGKIFSKPSPSDSYNGAIFSGSGAFISRGGTGGPDTDTLSTSGTTANYDITYFYASRSSATYKDNAPVQERATEMYLYFYVGNTVTVESEVNLDTLVTDVEKLKKDSGGSLEIGDIGFAPLGIDETKNLRRYLNGQVISQLQFVSFTNKIKSAIELYPNLATTETNWQAEVTNSKLGQCGKFVIDDTLGTIRLPKVVNINGLQDLALMGSIKAESLPNIKGTFYGRQNGLTGGSGAFYDGNNPYGGMGSGSYNNQMNFSASRSSSTYQDNAPVQQEAVQYPYFIQVATGTEESVDVTREIELNNPYSLFDVKFVDHTLDNSSWLISNGNWASGTVYVSAYEELLSEYNLGTEQTDGDITYKLTPKGYRIADVAEDTDVSALYTSQGVAWYYVLDTANTRFKLPQSKWGFVGCRNNVGGYVAESLPNITGDAGFTRNVSGDITGAFYPTSTNNTSVGGTGNTLTKASFDASRSSSTYQDNAPVQQRATEMYLYFYVGETIQDANVINASGVLTRVANSIDRTVATDRETVVGWGMPDYSAGIAKVWNTDISTTKNVRICYGGSSSNQVADSIRLYINNNLIGNYIIANSGFFMQWADIPAGATYKVTGGQSGQYIIEYPFKGAN